jgi:electron transfer flavoprotein alpha subunit
MKDSKNIIAINQDPEAPIFKISELSLVGDLRQVIPAVVEQLENLSREEKS